MIKVPATEAGIPAIEELTAAGVNVNITLLFSIARYEQVIDAYLAGLERRAAAGQPVDGIASVASFFVSRVDAKVDALLPAGLRAARPGRDRQRPPRLRALPRALRRRALAEARRARRPPAAAAVGQHRHQGPRLLRRALRRGADRPGGRQHDARGHPARVRRPRQRGPRRSAPTRAQPTRPCAAPRSQASTSTPSPPSSNAKACAPSATPTTSCSTASRPRSSAPSWRARRRRARR